MQIKRRELLGLVGLALGGCSTDSQPRQGVTVGARPTTSQTPDARRQMPGGEPGETGDTRPPTSQTPEEPSTTTVPVRVIEVIERAGWGAAPADAGMAEHAIGRLTIHHTGVALEENRLAPGRLRAHQAFHQNDRGWPDLAYHFAIDRNGNIYEGRSPAFRGDTATNYNPTGHFLVVVEGNFDVEPTTETQLGSLRHLLAWAAGHYAVGVDSIKSHRDYAPGETSCPGDNLYPLVESGELARAVGLIVAQEATELIYLRGEEAVGRVAEIEAP